MRGDGLPGFVQATRLLRIATPLGEDALTIARFRGEEAIGRSFFYEADCVAFAGEIAPEDIVGQPAVVTLTRALGDDTHFHGYVERFDFSGYNASAGAFAYRLRISPWTRFLAYKTDCRIFQDKSVLDIADEIFSEFGFKDYYVNETLGNYAPRTYCVQYNEDCLSFLQRLFEEEGIFYFFRHSHENHQLVLGDDPQAHKTAPEPGPRLRYLRPGMEMETDGAQGWTETSRLSIARSTVKDYNFETPKRDLTVGVESSLKLGAAADLERYSWPGIHKDTDLGERRAKRGIEAAEARFTIASASSNAPWIRAGDRFELYDHDLPQRNTSYAVLRVHHEASNNLEAGITGGSSYSNDFTCVDHTIPVRLSQTVERPVVSGVQTAFVTGPSGEEIHTDKYGRIKVQFHWDRRGQMDEKSSCWLRVAQSWAGMKWGGQFIPRIGMEVLVAFEEGNPDRPLVTGCVYNPDGMPSYALPGQATKSTIKTNSSPGGGGFNEIRFEDAKGEEQVFFHAEKDMDVRVQNDRRTTVMRHEHLTVEEDRRALIEGDDSLRVKGDRALAVGGDLGITVDDDIEEKAGSDILLQAGGEAVLRARSSITLRTGGSFVRITPGGVTISGPMVRINSGGRPSSRRPSPDRPQGPDAADTAKPGEVQTLANPPQIPRLRASRESTTQRDAMRQAARAGACFVEECD